MNNSEIRKSFTSEDVRYIELALLKSKIVDAIRFSEHYWMIFKENTFGLATILDLGYKKSYIELLFFPKTDVIQKGVPLVKIYTPLETQFNFHEVAIDPDLDKDGFVNPSQIIKRLDELIHNEIKYHLDVLREEIHLIDERFENYPIKDNPYFRKIIIYYPEYSVTLRINLENYPNIPVLSEKKQLVVKGFKEPIQERIKEKISLKYNFSRLKRRGEQIKLYEEKENIVIKEYKEPFLDLLRIRLLERFGQIIEKAYSGDLHEFKDREQYIKESQFSDMEIIRTWNVKKPPHIVDVIESILKIEKDSQHLILRDVSLEKELTHINLKVHRGESVGILYEQKEENQIFNETAVNMLFKAIAGTNSAFSGEISIFGKHIPTEFEKVMDCCFIASDEVEESLKKMSVIKGLLHNIYLIGTRKGKKKVLNNILEATGLLNKPKIKISDLSSLETRLFYIAKALLRRNKVIIVSFTSISISKLECEQFNSYVEKLKKNFHSIVIIYGPQDIVSYCDKIITIENNTIKVATLKDYISQLPQTGDIITIELDNPEKEALRKMLQIDSAVFIEERKGEKYKIFCIKEPPNKIIIRLMEIIGDYIYNFDIHQASLEDYLLYMQTK